MDTTYNDAAPKSLRDLLKGNLITLTLVLGIISAVLGLAPLVLSCFVGFRPLVWVFAILTFICAFAALVQKEDYNRYFIKFGGGIVLAIGALLVPSLFTVQYYAAVMEYGLELTLDTVKSVDYETYQSITSSSTQSLNYM